MLLLNVDTLGQILAVIWLHLVFLRIVQSIETISYFRPHAQNNDIEAFGSTGVFGGISLIASCISW